jgi:hypothetical protein
MQSKETTESKKELSMAKIELGDKVNRDTATVDQGKVRLGDWAPVFVCPTRAGDKVIRDAATVDQGKVRLGDWAPVFNPKK